MRHTAFKILAPLVVFVFAAGIFAIAGCGQSGPLYLPPPKAKPEPAQTVRSPAPATGPHLESGPV